MPPSLHAGGGIAFGDVTMTRHAVAATLLAIAAFVSAPAGLANSPMEAIAPTSAHAVSIPLSPEQKAAQYRNMEMLMAGAIAAAGFGLWARRRLSRGAAAGSSPNA
jgi:hypothetical protein